MQDIRQRRFETAVRRDDLREEIVSLLADHRPLQAELAERFDQIETSAHFVFEGCSSIRQFGERYGLSAFESITLRDAGKAMRLCPEARLSFVAGKISLDAVAALAKVLSDERMFQPGDDWLDKAQRLSTREFRREIRHRLAEVEKGSRASTSADRIANSVETSIFSYGALTIIAVLAASGYGAFLLSLVLRSP